MSPLHITEYTAAAIAELIVPRPYDLRQMAPQRYAADILLQRP